ncbi:MAG: dihydroorotase [Lachnospiraceae bacterium]|nr:dihydroorotase [Lachnospiraceae bacterium]
MSILIKHGRVLNPADNTDEILDIFVADGKIKQIQKNIDKTKLLCEQIIDAKDCYVMPGLIDLHVHLRDPGLTYKEDLKTGSQAAAKGGFTTIVAMANTKPVIDNAEKWTTFMARAQKESPIQVIQAVSLTKDMAGEEPVDFDALQKAGVTILSEDGKTVMNAEVFRQALQEAQKHNFLVLDHCEDAFMKGNGVFNAGETAAKLGVPGISNAVEDVIIARDLLIAKETKTRLHICHCSTADSVRLIALAKSEGLNITAEVCPHHFILTDKDIKEQDSNYKMAPPLRSQKDVNALIQGLQDGTIDAIVSDHAPHAAKEKTTNVAHAAFGIVGLETMVPLTISKLVKTGLLTPLQMAEKMSYNPAKILGIEKGNLSIGKDADITIIHPETKYVIDKNTFVSKGRNTPFDGMHVSGAVKATIYQGKVV